MRLWQRSCDEDIVRAISRLMSVEYQDYDDYVRKYGHPFSENPMAIAFGMVANFYEGIGIALHRKIIDIDLVSEFWDVQLGWKKVKPLVEGMRKEFDHPGLYEWFEYLSKELDQRAQLLDRIRTT